MTVRLVLEHLQLHLAQSFAPARSLQQCFVVANYKIARAAIRDGPETHHLTLCAREHQRAPQTVNAVAILHHADAGVARRQHHQLRAPEIEARPLVRKLACGSRSLSARTSSATPGSGPKKTCE